MLIAIYGEEAWTLRSQEIQSLEVFEMCYLRVIRGVTRADTLRNIKIREYTFSAESIMDVIRHRRAGGLAKFAVCKEITSLDKHINKISKDSRREEDH